MSSLAQKRLSILSENSEGGESRPLSPDGCNRSIKSFSSTSTLDSIAPDSGVNASPPLPARASVQFLKLRKLPSESEAPGWGVTLRGTTSELAGGVKIYTCHVETVHEKGAAKDAGLKESDQIVSIDNVQVKYLEHSDIVKIFQSRDVLVLTVLPSQFKQCSYLRIIKHNRLTLEYMWALMRHLQTLEVINVDIRECSDLKFDLSSLLLLRRLSVNHCSVETLSALCGLEKLTGLESLSLAYNLLKSEALDLLILLPLKKLKRLDLSRNVLNTIPESICALSSLEILILVDNNITEIPHFFNQLDNLQTLCLDGNLLREVDPVLRSMKSIQKLTISNNSLECESEVVKLNEFLITCIEGNPFCASTGAGISRNEPSLRRTLSVRGQLFQPKNRRSLEWDPCMTDIKLNDYTGTQ